MIMEFINLTPHPLVIRTQDGERTIAPSGVVARVSTTPGERLPDADGVELYTAPRWGEVEGLPDPAPGTIYIVSALVAARAGREDVYSPGTGPADEPVRDDHGRIVAVTRLVRSC